MSYTCAYTAGCPLGFFNITPNTTKANDTQPGDRPMCGSCNATKGDPGYLEGELFCRYCELTVIVTQVWTSTQHCTTYCLTNSHVPIQNSICTGTDSHRSYKNTCIILRVNVSITLCEVFRAMYALHSPLRIHRFLLIRRLEYCVSNSDQHTLPPEPKTHTT